MASIIRDSYSHLNSFVPLKKKDHWMTIDSATTDNTKHKKSKTQHEQPAQGKKARWTLFLWIHSTQNVSNPENEETIISQQEKANMLLSLQKKDMYTLPALMQHKDDISSYILYRYGLISLAKLKNIIKKHISPLLLCGIVELWSVNMVPNTIKIIVKNCQNTQSHWQKYQHHNWILWFSQ